MRKELYKEICTRLSHLYMLPDGSITEYVHEDEADEIPEGYSRVVRHIDLWNHNVEFIEQEENWERPAVFVEFCPIRWNAMVNGVEYRAEPEVKLHIVTDWKGAASEGSPFMEEALEVFDLPKLIHERLACMEGDTFAEFDLVESQTNHNHEEIVENIEVYRCVAFKRLQ